MKEVTKKDLPVVSGGDFPPDGCIPDPFKHWPDTGFPPQPAPTTEEVINNA